MRQAISKGEFEREGRRLLGKLSRTSGFLIKSAASTRSNPQYLLFSRRNEYQRPVGAFEETLINRCIGEGLLQMMEDEKLRITDAGRRWTQGRASIDGPASANSSKRHQATNRPIGDSPIAWLAKRKTKQGVPFLHPMHVQAADVFRRDFEQSQFMPSITSNWSPVYASRKERRGSVQRDPLSENNRVIAAKHRLNKAIDVLGPELTSLLLEVCCLMRGLEAAEQRLGWPKRSAKIVLKIGLERLADHYQLNGRQDRSKGPADIRNWGADGYRPDIPPLDTGKD